MSAARIKTASELFAVLTELHRRKAPLPPGVTVTGLINSLPVDERIQAHNFLTAYDATEAGYRSAPFAKEIPKEAVLLEASIDSHEQPSVEATDWMLQEARKEVVTSELLERMGTDADLPPEPPTTRDAVAAAVEAHGFGDHE